MFSKTVVLFVLTNVFLANCRPQLSQDQLSNALKDPNFAANLQQLMGYFATAQAAQQGAATSQLQSQQSSSQSSSQQTSSTSQRSDQQVAATLPGAALSTPLVSPVGQIQGVAGAQASSVNQLAQSSAQSQSTQSSQSSQSSLLQGVNINQPAVQVNPIAQASSVNQLKQSSAQSQSTQSSQSSQLNQAIVNQNRGNSVSDQLANLQLLGTQNNNFQGTQNSLAGSQTSVQQQASDVKQTTSVETKVEQSSQSQSQQSAQQNTQNIWAGNQQSQTGTQLAQNNQQFAQSTSQEQSSKFEQNTSSKTAQQANLNSGAYLNTLKQQFDANVLQNSNQFDATQPIAQGVYDPALEKIQSQNARYQYANEIDDNIEGNYQQKEETRQGGKVTGSYAYDDGNVLRKVVYEADENGFRVLSDQISASAKRGTALNGIATVKTYQDGNNSNFQISNSDIRANKHCPKCSLG